MRAEPAVEPAESPRTAAERVCGSLAAVLRLVANEASVGLFFVQEHVHKSAPFVLATKVRRAAGACCSELSPGAAGPRPRDGQAGAAVQVRATLTKIASADGCGRLDVDAGLETLKLVRDFGSPALLRMTSDVARAQRALEAMQD